MKYLFLLSVCIVTLACTVLDNPQLKLPKSRNTPTSGIDWKGKYEYSLSWENGFVNYSLTIADANACLIEAEGHMTSYKILCVGRNNGDKYEIYFFKSIGDEPIGFNSNEHDNEMPLLTLYYKSNILYTVDDGFLLKHIENPTKRLFIKFQSQEDELTAPVDTNRRY